MGAPADIQARLAAWLAPLGPDLPALYLVGGAVRDLLLNRPVKDIDMMTADPLSLGKLLARDHNAALVPFVNKAETPCYRIARRGDAADFLDLVPIHGASVEADLHARDFTINAMALAVEPDGRLAALIDPLGGRQDLIRRRIRMSDATVFAADPLRMLRAVRFAAELGFTITRATRDQIRRDGHRIACVAAERIWSELHRLLDRRSSAAWVKRLDDLGLLPAILPELAPMKGCVQNDHHHLDVWRHSLAVLQNAEKILADPKAWFGPAGATVDAIVSSGPKRLALKLAALLHDVGKPATRGMDPETGRITFFGHDEQGAGMVEAIAQRLRLPNLVRQSAVGIVADHMHALFLSHPAVKPGTLARWFRRLGDDMVLVILLSMADRLAARGPASDRIDRRRHLDWCRQAIGYYAQDLKPRLGAKPLVGGKDLIAMGMAPGPEVGKMLVQIRQAQDDGRVNNREQALSMAADLLPGGVATP